MILTIQDLVALRYYYYFGKSQSPENIRRIEKIEAMIDQILDAAESRRMK